MQDILLKALNRMESTGAQFCDAKAQTVRTMGVQSINGDIRQLLQRDTGGICLRAWIDGRWGYGTVTSFDESDISAAAEAAVRNAKGSPKGRLRLEPDTIVKSMRPNVKIHPDDVDLEEKIKAVLDVDRAQEAEKVLNRVGSYAEEVKDNIIVNSVGSMIDWQEVRTRFGAMSIASEGPRLERYYDGPSGTAGYELVKDLDIERMGREVAEEAVRTLKAVRPPSGKLTVISDPMMSGLLAHEAMGHPSEADEVTKKRSFLTDCVGMKVGTDIVDMFDNGLAKGAYGSCPFDDEGTLASNTQIIKDGVYEGYMHSLETASELGSRPTGNGRAENFGKRVWVRMTNTYFGPGDRTVEDIIADTRYGILCDKMYNGMEDPVGGGFEAKCLRGHLIENGRITELLQSFTLTGRALEVLQTTDAVSKDVILDGGMCGKGIEDWVNVSSGGPYMRSRMIVGGGE
ncbi:MAG: TldD/PmbA family protein [Candidatus Methanomethylophilaceae archaeon]